MPLSADDIPALIESEPFKALPAEERVRLTEEALAEGADSLKGAWDQESYQKWGQFASKVREQVAGSETMMEKAGWAAGVAAQGVKDMGTIVGTAAVGLSPVLPVQGKAEMQMPGMTLGKAMVTNMAGLVTGQAEKLVRDVKPVQSALDEVKRGIDNGAFFQHPDGLPGWLDEVQGHVAGAASRYYGPSFSEWSEQNGLITNPENAQLLNTYLRTRSPQAWTALQKNIERTPAMAQIAERQRQTSNETTLGRALAPEARPMIAEAADPAEIIPGMFAARQGARAVQRGVGAMNRAKTVGKGVAAEMASEQISGTINDPNLSLAERGEIAKQTILASLGIMGAGAAVGATMNRLQPGQTETPDGLPTTQTPGAAGAAAPQNPFDGPIQPPPQPTEDGGTVGGGTVGQPAGGPLGPQPVPPFQDNPLGTLAPQPAGGNVLVDFGIQRTPEAQAALEAEQAANAASQTKAQGQLNQSQRRMPLIPDNPLGYRDILDYVNDNPLFIPRKDAEASRSGDYDWAQSFEMPQYYRKFLASSERGHSADVLAQMAYDEGYISEPTPDALMNQMQKTMRERTQFRLQLRERTQEAKQQEKQATNFERSQTKSAGKEFVDFDSLKPGDQVTIENEDVIVRDIEYDADGMLTNIVLEDGPRFGVLSIDPQSREGLLVNAFKPRDSGGGTRPPLDEDMPFLPRNPNFTARANVAGAAAASAGLRGPTAAAQTRPARAAESVSASPSESGFTAQLASAYRAAARGSSSQFVPIRAVYEQAQKATPGLTVEQFMDELQSADHRGEVLLEVPENASTLKEAGPFSLRMSSGVPATNMTIPQPKEEVLAMPRGRATTGTMASESGAAQANTEPSPGGLTEAEFQKLVSLELFDDATKSEAQAEVAKAGLKWNNLYPKAKAAATRLMDQIAALPGVWNHPDANKYDYPRAVMHRLTALSQSDFYAAQTPGYESLKMGLSEAKEANEMSADIRPFVLFRGENEFPGVANMKVLPGDASGVSNSIYPYIQATLTNGAKFIKKIRVSDHDQVSDRAPRYYAIDLRMPPRQKGERKASYERRITDAASDQIEQAAREKWQDQHEIIKNATPVSQSGMESSAMLGERGGVTVRDSQQPEGAGSIPQSFSASVNPESSRAAGGTSEEVLAMAAPGRAGPLPTMHTAGLPAADPGGYPASPAPQMPAGTQAWSGKVQTLHGIRQFLLNKIGLPAVGVRRFTQHALGIYKAKPETIRLQAINDIPVLSHEIGHHIHYKLLTKRPSAASLTPAESWDGRYDAELMPLGQVTSTPEYTPDMVRKEGVAEFTRLWLTNPALARAQAPSFSAFFESDLRARHPKVAEALREAQGMIADYIAMPAFEKAKAQVVFDPAAEQARKPIGHMLKDVYARFVNTLQPALDVTRQAAQIDPTLSREAADVEMWMENHRGGWAGKAGRDIFGQQTDLHGKVVGEGLQKILSGLKPGEAPNFSAYLALKRANEIERSGKRSGFEQARLPAAEMKALEARFEPMRQKLIKWQRNERDLLVQSGLLDAKSAAAMDAANADYVPFYRLYEKLNGVSFGPEGSKNAGGYVDLNSGIRALKGSDRAIIDPLQSAMKNAFMFRKIAEQNLIGVKFFDLVRQVQGGGQWGEAIAPKMKPNITRHETVVKKLIDEGVIKDEGDLPSNADLTLRLFEAVTRPDTKNGEVIVFKDGKREHWEIKDPLLMQALKTADADAVKLGNFPSFFLKIFTAPAKALRWGATGGPWFALPNLIRDQVQGGVFSQSGGGRPGKSFIPFWDGVKGGMEILRKGDAFEKWKQAGGEFAGQVTGTKAFTRLLEEALPQDPVAQRALQGLGDPKAWLGGLRNALDLVGAFGRFTEQATRLGEFMRAKEAGASDMAAANFSKTLSLNFARAGEVSRVLNQFIPFFNATVQGLDQFIRMHADPKTRGTVMMKGLMYITVPSLLTWALGKDDEEIQNLPDYRKNLFWNINLKPLANALGMPEKGFILSLPKPFLLGAVYGTSVERALDYATGRDPNGARKAAANILQNTINPLEIATSVAGLRPLIEAQTNKSLFTDRDIVPQGYQYLPKEQQYSTLTSETAKTLGRWTGQSPMMIDHLLRGYFATSAQFGTAAIDYGMAKLSLADVPDAPSRGLTETPLGKLAGLNRFTGTPYASNAFVGRFYEAAHDMEGKLAVLSKQAEQMTTDQQRQWWESNKSELGWYERTVNYETGRTGAGDVRAAMRTMSEINAAMKDIQASRVIKPDEKRSRMIELSQQRNELAERAYKALFPPEVVKRHW